ncbi:MAG: tetratricopeptide repeat protein [Bacteroidota bacterium]
MKKNYFTLFVSLSIFIYIACGENNNTDAPAEVGAEVVNTGNSAVDKLTRQIAEMPDNASLYAARGGAYYENENYDEGIEDLEKAISIDSTRAEYFHVLADMYMDYYKSRMALNTMKRAGEAFPERIPTLLKLAEYELILKQHNDALFTLEKIRKIDPLNAEMFFMFGRVFKDMGRIEEAGNAFQSAVENDPELIDAWISLAQIIAEKNPILAERYFDNAMRIDSNNIDVLHAQAYYFSNIKDDLPEAIRVYKKINTIDPQYVEGYFNVGLIYLDMDSVQQAYQSFDIASKYAPENADVYYHRGVAAEMMGNNPQALADYKTVLNFDPSYASAKAGVQRLSQ